MYNLYGKTEFPFFHHIETELKIFRNGKGNFLKRKISAPTIGKENLTGPGLKPETSGLPSKGWIAQMEEHWYISPEVSGSSPGPVKFSLPIFEIV